MWGVEGGGRPSRVDGGREGGAVGARLLDEQRAARVALARALAAFEVSDGADHRVDKVALEPVGFLALRVGKQLEVDGFQHVGARATIGSAAPPRHGGSRIGIAVAAVVEQGHGDGVGAADRLQQEARERDVRPHRERGEGGSGVESEGGDYQGGDGVYLPGRMRERMHLRQAEERDVVFERDVVVIGVRKLPRDLQSL